MSRRNLIYVSAVGIALFITLMLSQEVGLCLPESACTNHADDIALIFLPSIPLFLFSIITYASENRLYQSWWRFACIATPISMLLILLAPSYSHDWMFPVEKGSVALLTSIGFSLVSVYMLLHHSIRGRKNQ
jgi:hypothetical protein